MWHGNSFDNIEGTGIIRDVRVEHMAFLSESVLLVYLSNKDIRVMHTTSFAANAYKNPLPIEVE